MPETLRRPARVGQGLHHEYVMSTAFSTFVSRLRADLRLALIMLFGVITSLAILPFLVVRALYGEWLAAGLDLAMIAVLGTSLVYAWRTGRYQLVGSIDAVAITIACAILTWKFGGSGHYWIYAAIVATFMVAPRIVAIPCTLVLLSMHLLFGDFPDQVATWAFLTSALLVAAFAAVFVSLGRRQHRQLMVLATMDPLTGLPNRRALETELADALRHHEARGEPAALAVLDLDHFKRINDRHGHEAGDQVLVELAERIQGVLRKRDRLFRLGGEEFVVLLPATDAGGARAAMEKVRRAVELQPMGAPGLRASVSVGVAMREVDDEWPAWLARADEAMYESKRRGRNQVRMYPPALLPGERRERAQGREAARKQGSVVG